MPLADSKKQEPFQKYADKIYDITSGNLISPRSSLLPDCGRETVLSSKESESAEQKTPGSAVESSLNEKSEETDHRSLRSLDSSEDKTTISSDFADKAEEKKSETSKDAAAKPEDQVSEETAAAAAAAAVEQQRPSEADIETIRSSDRQSEEFESSVLKVSDSETPPIRSAATEPTIEAKRMFRKQ